MEGFGKVCEGINSAEGTCSTPAGAGAQTEDLPHARQGLLAA